MNGLYTCIMVRTYNFIWGKFGGIRLTKYSCVHRLLVQQENKVSEGQLIKQYTVYWSELERKISYPLFNKFQSSFVLANSEQFHAPFLIRCKSNNLSYKISDKFYPFVACLKKEAKQKISRKWHKTVTRILYPLTLFADQPLRIRQLIVIRHLWASLIVFKN